MAGPTLKRKSLHPSFKASKGGGFIIQTKMAIMNFLSNQKI